MSELQGLIFDVDGVIADTESINARASIQVFEELFGLRGVRREDFEAGLGRGAEEYVRAAARVHGLELDDAQVAAATRLRQERFLEILSAERLPAYPGVLSLIEAARASEDFAVGIATSSTREKSQAVLDSARIPWRELAYVNGSEVRNKKPDPELFLTAAARLGVPPQRCVVIEDAPNGVEAAHRAGCRVVAVTHSVDAEKLRAADRVVSSLEELDLDTLRSLLTG